MNARKRLMATLLVWALTIAACTVPAWVNTVEADVQIAVPIAASLIDVIDPSLAPLVTLIETGFSALTKTLDTFKAAPTATNLQAVQAAFNAVNANVAQLENAAQIKNTATKSTVTEVVQLLAQAVTEIAALVPANAGLGTRGSGLGNSASPSHQAKGWKAKDFKSQFNLIIKGDPRFKPLK